MAEIKKRKKKNGEWSYTVCVRIKGSPMQSKTFSRRTDAQEWESKMETSIKENINFPKRKAQRYTVADVIDQFIEDELPKKTPKMQKEFLKSLNWFRKEIGSLHLSSVNTEILVACQKKLSQKNKEVPMKKNEPMVAGEKISNATVNRYLMYLRVMFSYCLYRDIIDINPMAKLKKLPEDNARKRCLDTKEIKKLLEACTEASHELYLCVLIALLTSARKSEILNLTWGTVDFENKMLYFLDTKNGTDRGTPMHDNLYDELIAYKNNNKVHNLKNDYLFKTADGKPNEALIGKLFRKVVKKCGIEDFKFHDLRHTSASHQAMSGVSQPITQKTLGHKSPMMTNRYSHLRDENLRPTINQVGNKMLADWKRTQDA